MEIVKVPYSKLNEYAEWNVCSILAESDKIPKGSIFWYRHKQYVCTGAISHNHKYISIDIYQIVHHSKYDGRLKPLSRGDHWREIDEGRRERSYIGRMVSCDGQKYVFVYKLQFEPISGNEEEGQLALF